MTNLYIFKTKKKNLANLIYKTKKINCLVGINGIGKKTREGDGITPCGTFKFTKIYYRNDRVKLPKIQISKKIIRKNSYWCVDPKSHSYNSYQENLQNFACEKLYRTDCLYDIFITLDYNIGPTKKYKGSAIFMHCSDKHTKFTEGCLAVERKKIFEIIKIISPSSRLIVF